MVRTPVRPSRPAQPFERRASTGIRPAVRLPIDERPLLTGGLQTSAVDLSFGRVPWISTLRLRERFGYERFNPGQEEVIGRVLAGEDTLAILATGAGKSLCYQLPALLLPGTTVVVSPLIALMKDQLDMLPSRGVRETVALNSTLTEDQEAAAMARIASGAMKIVFVTPEKLEDDAFVAILQTLDRAALRRRRSALHQPVGPRFPAGLSEPRARDHSARKTDRARADRDRDAGGARRHPRPARAFPT